MDAKKLKIIRCLDLAKNGLGNTLSNPLVGALIAIDDHVLGEGYHQKYGGPHAEVNAINAIKDHSLLKLSTLFVNLEPCSHFGKTPPCADLIIEKKIPHVVIGMIDPFSEVAGRGIEKLKNAGIDVVVGVGESECRELNKRFITFHEKRRPFIILKWAETSDGFIDKLRTASNDNKPNWITDELARVLVHKWRTEEQAILIGTNTAWFDNPKLTARDFSGNNPIRMVIDRSKRLPQELAVFDKSAQTIVFTENETFIKENVRYEKAEFDDRFPQWFCNYCFENHINSVIVEGGAKLLQCFINAGLWDEARIFKGDITFEKGIRAPQFDKNYNSAEKMKNSVLEYYKNYEL